ncbi:MAG: RagB/SusD family nutrient uptake outer membrane protein [Lachnoclostridium sp.]|nr:RagB/SusD family nutrient uptake outer membrane protein [Lachnoclostridium sp.]
MKKHFYNILLAVAALCSAGMMLQSCADDLDVTPDGRMDDAAIFSTPENTKDYFASAWAHVPQKMFRYYFFDNLVIDMSDDAWSTDDYSSLLIGDIYAGNLNSTKHLFEWDSTDMDKWDGGYWSRYWMMIRILNNCIINFPEAAFDSEAERDQCIAEARVLRAFYYLMLVKFYGDLPIIEDVNGVTTDYSDLTREPAWKVLQWVVSECELALKSENLPWAITNVQLAQRMTKGIACAIISQASLFAASPLFCHGENLWNYAYQKNLSAYNQLKANGYALYTTLTDPKSYSSCYEEYFASRSYAGSKADDHETIWGGTWMGVASVNLSTINGVPLFTDSFKAGTVPTQELVDAFDMLATGEPIYDLANPYKDEKHSDININSKSGYDPANPYDGRDPRFYACIFYNTSKINTGVLDKTVETWNNEITWDGKNCTYKADKGTSGSCKVDATARRYTRTGYYNRKYHAYKTSPSQSKDEGNWKYFRLGEVYLNLAEAAIEDGKVGDGIALINEIRHRAGFSPSVDKKTTDQVEARRILRHERQIELCYEEHRYFDVRRWGTSDEPITEEIYNTGMWIHKDGKNYVYQRFPLGGAQGAAPSKNAYEGKNRLIPIPLKETNRLGAATGLGADYWQNPGW